MATFDDYLAGVLAAGDPVRIRLGVVRGIGGSRLQVQLGDTTIVSAFYLDSVANLAVGDRVVMLADNRRALVIGRPAGGEGPPRIPNADFQLVDSNSQPRYWTVYHASTAATVTVELRQSIRAVRVLSAIGGSTPGIDTLVHAAPLTVKPGQVWSLSATVRGQYTASQLLDATLGASWFGDSADVYPNNLASSNSAAQALANVPAANTGMSGNVTVPTGAAFMRVYGATVSGVGEAGALYWWNFDAQLVTDAP